MSCLETREAELLLGNCYFAITNLGTETLLVKAVSGKKLVFDAFDV